jgi:Ca2+-binding RTX toxin-like protein
MANVYGNDTNQTLKGTAGADQLYGGAGHDILLGNVIGALSDIKGDGSQASPLTFELTGATGDDMLDGGTGSDALHGGDGNDVLYGGEDNDSGVVNDGGTYYKAGLYGGDGNDVIYGGGGDDEIYGGLGQDSMYGGTGTDTFFFSSIAEIGKGSTADLIGDFVRKQGDVIDLSAIDAKEGKNGKVKINTDDDKGAEAVLFVNTHKMVADDFVL